MQMVTEKNAVIGGWENESPEKPNDTLSSRANLEKTNSDAQIKPTEKEQKPKATSAVFQLEKSSKLQGHGYSSHFGQHVPDNSSTKYESNSASKSNNQTTQNWNLTK